MKASGMLMAVLMAMAGGGSAADFSDLQTFKASDVKASIAEDPIAVVNQKAPANRGVHHPSNDPTPAQIFGLFGGFVNAANGGQSPFGGNPGGHYGGYPGNHPGGHSGNHPGGPGGHNGPPYYPPVSQPQPGSSMQTMNFQSGLFQDPYVAEDSMNRAIDRLSSVGYSVIENRLNGTQYTLVFNAPAFTRIQRYTSGQYNDNYSAGEGLNQAVSAIEQGGKIIVETRLNGNMFYLSYMDRTGPILPPVNPPVTPQQMCGGSNTFGTYYAGGGCNTFGCWKQGSGCNTFGCWKQGGGCNTFGCYTYGGGCNTFGCWRAGGNCGTFGCAREVPSYDVGSQPCRR